MLLHTKNDGTHTETHPPHWLHPGRSQLILLRTASAAPRIPQGPVLWEALKATQRCQETRPALVALHLATDNSPDSEAMGFLLQISAHGSMLV